MAEFYNYDGVVVPFGVAEDKPFGKACMRQGYLIYKISDKVYPQAKSSAFALNGTIVNETMTYINDNMIIDSMQLRCDKVPTVAPTQTFSVSLWATDDPENPTVSNFANILTVGSVNQSYVGQVYLAGSLGISPKVFTEPYKFIVIEGDMTDWGGYEATLFVDFAEA